MSLCMCKLCLNAHLVFDVVKQKAKQDGDEISESLAEFYMDACKCNKDMNGFYKWKCVQGKCNDCKKAELPKLILQSSNEVASVDQFEKVEVEYKNSFPKLDRL